MKYFVTGATGLVGSHVIRELLSEGHGVVGLTRSRSKATHLPDEVTVVEGDITKKGSMREAMVGVDGVFHLAAWALLGPGPRNTERAERINVEGTRNVLELIADLGVDRGVYTSTIAVYGDTEGKTVDETYCPSGAHTSVYHRTKWRAQYEVARPMMEDGLPLITVLPGIVYGPGGKTHGNVRSLFRDYIKRQLLVIPRAFTMSWEFAKDTARSHVRAMERGDPGEEYIIANDARSIGDVFAIAEEITGIPAPRPVSPAIFDTLGRVMSAVERVGTPPEGFEAETLRTVADTEVVVDNSKAKRELGIEHRPLEAGLREYLEWERKQLKT